MEEERESIFSGINRIEIDLGPWEIVRLYKNNVEVYNSEELEEAIVLIKWGKNIPAKKMKLGIAESPSGEYRTLVIILEEPAKIKVEEFEEFEQWYVKLTIIG